ncbi:MAG: bifunctional metallophosphatase/5'-nucleotidase, partial [Longispora sp.]|nr:bifunctional metallophosphatase/5'-nucleotidase [Longispora sp. (in: high G+C Gram-positive bacteria)]
MRRLLTAATVTALTAGALAAGTGVAQSATAGEEKQVKEVQILAINDFHGHLEPPSGSSGVVTTKDHDGTIVKVPAGGATYLATHLKSARQGKPLTTTVAAGDLVGASPLLSAAFHDEPTVNVLGDIGLEAAAVGNHEFDKGVGELLRLQNGGCHLVDGCLGGSFDGAKFKYLAANVEDKNTNIPVLPPYWVKDFGGGVKIGFIGMTLEGTPNLVMQSGIAGLRFTDEVATANRYTRELRRSGVNAIVVLLHEGGVPSSEVYDYDCNANGNLGLTGPIVDIAKNVSESVDLLVTGHTHQSYACAIPDPLGRPRMVTSAGSFGREYTDISVGYDIDKREIVRVAAQNKIVTRNVPTDPDVDKLIKELNDKIAPIANRPVGVIAGEISRGTTGKRESSMGNLIADAQLAATSKPENGGAEVAFVNPGGIRTDLTYKSTGVETPGVVTYGDAYAVHPFNNSLVTKNMTGAQILTILNQQITGTNSGTGVKILQVSKGFTYTLTNYTTVTD